MVILRGILLAVAMSTTMPVAADSFTYFKLGNMNVDGPQKDHPLNLALGAGYELDSYVADFSVAAEINRSIDEGEYARGGSLEFESNAIFLVYKSTRSLFVTARIGLVETKTIISGDTSRDEGIALGGGVGVVIGRTRLLWEFVSYNGDATHFGIGLQF
jgi:hypothetical protein